MRSRYRRIGWEILNSKTDHRHRPLLRLRCTRPSNARAREQAEKPSPPHGRPASAQGIVAAPIGPCQSGLDRALPAALLCAMSALARDTIFALSSGRPPRGDCGCPHVRSARRRRAEGLAGKLPEPRKADLARVRDPDSGEVIDEALALWFPGPNSETGEDIAELQLHGGRAVIAAVLGALGRIEGLRPAEAGEFTRRAFENGRLDLTAVEGLADLIGAETEAQRRQAYAQLKGLLGDRAETWRAADRGTGAGRGAHRFFRRGGCAGGFDRAGARRSRAGCATRSRRRWLAPRRGERLRDGLVVAIAGPPNAGKSTLLNRIARREVAIVSPIAGTTRDVIEVHLDLDGYPVTVLDTAGIRDSDDPVEQEGVRRARQRASEADLILWVYDAEDEAVRGRAAPVSRSVTTWMVRNKIDLAPHLVKNEYRNDSKLSDIEFNLSASTGFGVADFVAQLAKYTVSYFGRELSLLSRERHRKALHSHQKSPRSSIGGNQLAGEELVAEELRSAAQTLGRLTGRVDAEDILDVIFRDFCIGK